MSTAERAAHPIEELLSDPRALVDLALDHPVLLSVEGGNRLLLVGERHLHDTDEVFFWLRVFLHTSSAIEKPATARMSADFPEAPWLAEFDDEDLSSFLDELRASLIDAIDSGDSSDLELLVSEWKSTARAIADPERREVLLGSHRPDDFIEIQRPA